MASAEIVQINPASQRPKCIDVAGNRVIWRAGNNGFKHLDRQTIWGQVKPVQFPFDLFEQFGIVQFGTREIDTDLRHLHPRAIPCFQRGQKNDTS